MATFIPVGQTSNYNGSMGEMMVYEAFKKLPDNIVIFYSVKWGEEGFGHKFHRGEADFLLFDPARGFIVFEVKTGGIERDADGRWFSIDREGKEHLLSRSPLAQAQNSVDRFRKILDESDNPTIRNYKIIPTAWFPNLAEHDIFDNLPDEYKRANTLSQADIDMTEAAVNRIFSRNNVETIPDTRHHAITKEVIDLFAPTFKLVPSMSADLQYKDFLFNQLTREQAALLDYLGEQNIAGIHGASGTGKTMIALECARRLPSDENVLFLCFNRLLLNFLIDNYAAEMPNVTFTSLNRLYAKTHGSEKAEPEELSNFLVDEFMDDFEYRHIIIDEGQDFAADHLDFLIEAIKATGGYFYVFYDKNQVVHYLDQDDEATLNWLKKLDCRLILKKNCRNTLEIAESAYAPVGINDVVLAQHINGDKPCLNNYSSKERAIQGIADTIRFYTEKGFKRNQITILTVKTLAKSILADCDSVSGYRLAVDGEGDGILFTTARKFKGLESDVVILIDVDEDVFKDEMSKCVFYVASSRAKHCLTCIASLSDKDIEKIISDLGQTPDSNPRRMLANLLNISVKQID